MDSHAVIKEFSGLIKSAVLAGEMPPWHAEPQYRDFSNDKALSVEEVNQLVAWIDAGAPRGDGPDPLPEASQVLVEDWPMGPPIILFLSPFSAFLRRVALTIDISSSRVHSLETCGSKPWTFDQGT